MKQIICTFDYSTVLLFIALSNIVTAFDENSSSSSSSDLVKEYTYNCPWCKDSTNTRIRTMWPIPTYKPVSWDRYYIEDVYGNRTTVGSGIAAGITIGVFFTVFLLTFGCRVYSARIERLERERAEREIRNTIIHPEDFAPNVWICGSVPRDPPPPYEIAITMPRCDAPPPPPISNSQSTCSTNFNQQTQNS